MSSWILGIPYLIDRIFAGLLLVLAAVVIAGLVGLVVRFLLVATRAAQLYVARNEPPKPVSPPASGAPSHLVVAEREAVPEYAMTREYPAAAPPSATDPAPAPGPHNPAP
ncbi:MAG: hypothetical protein ACYCZK_00370 [Microbacteriaceae bacterium]